MRLVRIYLTNDTGTGKTKAKKNAENYPQQHWIKLKWKVLLLWQQPQFFSKFAYQILQRELSAKTHNFGIFNCILINSLRVSMRSLKIAEKKPSNQTISKHLFFVRSFVWCCCVFSFSSSNSNLCFAYVRANTDRAIERSASERVKS